MAGSRLGGGKLIVPDRLPYRTDCSTVQTAVPYRLWYRTDCGTVQTVLLVAVGLQPRQLRDGIYILAAAHNIFLLSSYGEKKEKEKDVGNCSDNCGEGVVWAQ